MKFPGYAIAATALLGVSFAILWLGGWLHPGERELRPTNHRSEIGAQEPRKTVVLDGVEIAYTDSGARAPVLIGLHAIGHGARDFEDLSRRLGSRYRVIALDFPGHGHSGPDSTPASGTRYTEILTRFIETLDLRDVTLLGNSIGGAAAIRYTSLHPERVKGLVLCDTGGLGPPGRTGRMFIGAFAQFFAAGRRGAPWFSSAFARYYRSVLKGAPAREERGRIVRAGPEMAGVLEQAWRSFAKPEEDLSALLPSIRCPVFLAWAKEDVVLPLERSAPFFERFPNRVLEVFEGGHSAFLEDPDKFERSVRRFLEDVYADGALSALDRDPNH